jgi:FkbM family methyltransferase
MPLLNRVRLFANKVLAPYGFAVERVKKRNPWDNSLVTIRVGRYSIQAPRASQMATLYHDTPDYMSELASLVSLLKKKYPSLSAMDIGANIGDTACIIKSAADIPVICIEGDDSTFRLLEQNLRQFQNVTAHKLFLGEKSGNMAATFEKSGWNATIKPGQFPAAQTINISSLDDFLATQAIPSPCKLLKIDAEGFDCSIIRGATKFIRQSRPALMFEYNRDNMSAIGEKGLETLAMLRDLGYSEVAFHDCNGRFFTGAALSNDLLVRDLLDYADGRDGSIYYFDLAMFHQEDADIAREFISAERSRRVNAQ